MTDIRLSFTWRQWMESEAISPVLKEVLLDVLALWPDQDANRTAEVTCIRRTVEEDKVVGGSGIHVVGPPFRAIDLRNKDWGPDHQGISDAIAERVNKTWVYDPGRPSLRVCITAQHGTGPHVHLQVCKATRRRTV